MSFGFQRRRPPAEATLVVDCRHMIGVSMSNPAAREVLATARRHLAEGVVIAFGCSWGQARSVAVAEAFAREAAARFSVEVLHCSSGRHYRLGPP